MWEVLVAYVLNRGSRHKILGEKENKSLSKCTSRVIITKTDMNQKTMNHQQTAKSSKIPLNKSPDEEVHVDNNLVHVPGSQ